MDTTNIKYYFCNWKMYQSIKTIRKFVRDYKKDSHFIETISKKHLGIAAGYDHLYFLDQKLKHTEVKIGAQDCSEFINGAYTGQVSVESLAEMQMSFCIVGHSEARQFLSQSDRAIVSKFKLLIAANINPIFCIGETLAQKEEGLTLQVLCEQLEGVLEFLQMYHGSTKIFIAYEPIYAIGAGIIPSQEDLQYVFSFLNDLLQQVPVAKNVMFLYGGSVSKKTVSQLSNIHGISGFLIGKASIDFQELKKIVN